MDAADFERVYQAFGEFHSFFAPLFGRRESRDHSRHYLHPVLVQAGDRRNAETLSGSVGVSVRAMQRFLTEGPGRDVSPALLSLPVERRNRIDQQREQLRTSPEHVIYKTPTKLKEQYQ